MDKIILKNKTEFEIAEGASLGNIQIQSKGFDGIKSITDAFSGEDGAEDGTYTVTVSLRTKTEMEKAIDELKAGHEANAEAIEELANIATESEA